ncbi:PAS domain-containing sensor histidine kinase [Azohydromonas lata]|uniref:PAS domain-containing sensor histidine kinase n=1 Tax=Azohydromonas lata TaxID=45677 RepID=UPI000829E562|nr:HAMP domain-containing sensor histidine kinase [Azohydromonas lata]
MDDALWWPAPHPALGVWRDAGGALRWRCNPAAQHWARRLGVGEDLWPRWAQACAEAAPPLAPPSAPASSLPAAQGDAGEAAAPLLRLPGAPAVDATLCPQGEGVLAWLVAESEAHSRHELERLALAVQAAGLGVWESDLDGRTLYWNEAMYRLRGLDPGDPRPVWQLSRLTNHPDDQRVLSELPRRHVEAGEPYAMDLRVRWPDGSEHWLATRGRALSGGPGQPVRMVGVNGDITDRMRAQAAELERERAEQASRAKSALLARVSHELRTPLNAVLGFAQLLQLRAGQVPGPQQAEWARHIAEAGQHLLLLIDDLLELAGAGERGQAAPQARPVALAPLVEEALHWSAAQARQAGVHVLPPQQPVEGSVLGDARRVRQVLLNLLSNAIKYNRAGGEVRLSSCGPDDGALRGLCVADTGPGLAPEQMQQLGEPFNRLGAEQRGIPGTGIGLAISRELLQRMGGRLEVQSTVGQGSRFTMWLPAAQP